MGFYSRFILPRLIDLDGKGKEATQYRKRVIPKATGTVLEIGVGSGLNLPFDTNTVSRLYAVEPSRELLAMARPKAEQLPFP